MFELIGTIFIFCFVIFFKIVYIIFKPLLNILRIDFSSKFKAKYDTFLDIMSFAGLKFALKYLFDK
ncbi:hypothetical protein [Campylobacter fetus]|uniref:hypothetical protein n=1 Tax=Campylobacter fetus TaxID=196 RepID=UPI00073AA003|nr:hypothetical protein [Campylobacter fetus]ALV64668.1 hypothetical protein CFTSP3_0699 [Campylobacter fetus subsp. testudinum Sp3]